MIGQDVQYESLLRTRVSGDDRVWGRDSILVTRDRRDSNIMRTVSINKHLKLRIMRGRAVEGLTVRDSDTSPLSFY